MRAIRRTHRRFPVPALLGAAALALGACQRDAPMGVLPDDANVPIVPFTIAPGAADAVRTSTQRSLRTWAIVKLRKSIEMSFTGDGGTINSPFDMTYVGGALVSRATNWNVYVNCPTDAQTCWGTDHLSPGTFLRDLNRSPMLSLADQYTGHLSLGQFKVSELSTNATFVDNTATIADIFSIVFSASTAFNASGYRNIFHVFLPQGTDMCIAPGFCYSPDHPENFAFCAFHGSVDFGPDQHVLFSVEPYQGVDGCVIPGQAPHGVIDATASTLSHEFFETISDPDGDGWFNFLTGSEIGDLCFAFGNNEHMNGHDYVVQPEYSNSVHNCADRK
jgi:hypothetical protein